MKYLKDWRTYAMTIYIYITGITIIGMVASCAFDCQGWHLDSRVFELRNNGYVLDAIYLIPALLISWTLAFTPFIFRGVIVGMLAFFSGLAIYASYMW